MVLYCISYKNIKRRFSTRGTPLYLKNYYYNKLRFPLISKVIIQITPFDKFAPHQETPFKPTEIILI